MEQFPRAEHFIWLFNSEDLEAELLSFLKGVTGE
jgi:hypothetical protein